MPLLNGYWKKSKMENFIDEWIVCPLQDAMYGGIYLDMNVMRNVLGHCKNEDGMELFHEKMQPYYQMYFEVNPVMFQHGACWDVRRFILMAMEEENKAAIAKTVLGEKETLIMIRTKNGQMHLNTLFFEEEVQKNPSKEVKDSGNTQELKMAKAIIESMIGEFKPEEYKDEYIEKVKNAIERKIAGKEIVSPKEGKETKVIDLIEALKKSLTQVQRPKTNRTTKKKQSVKKAQ
jgi:non-homologous end joining protein Ku